MYSFDDVNVGNPELDLNIPFVIGLSAILSLLLLLLIIIAVYYTFFCGSSTFGYDLGDNFSIRLPQNFQVDDDKIKLWEKTYFPLLTDEEKDQYLLGKHFFHFNKPNVVPQGTGFGIDAQLSLRDRGINIFYFESYTNHTDLVSDQINHPEKYKRSINEDSASFDEEEIMEQSQKSSLIAKSFPDYGAVTDEGTSTSRNIPVPFYIEDRTDIIFTTDKPHSTTLNFPLPTKNRRKDTVYFEAKLYEFNPANTLISVGLCCKPYPDFRLPGYNPYSIGIESSGHLRLNRPFINDSDTPVLLPQLIQGDVIGIGYKYYAGSVYVTHNGKKIMEVLHDIKLDLYPCIGSTGGRSQVSVNLGQLGFVFIEANVKKLGFCEGDNEGSLGAPPIYLSTKEDVEDTILQTGEALPPEYPENETTFFGPKAYLQGRVAISKPSSLPLMSPRQVRSILSDDYLTHTDDELSSRPPSYISNSSDQDSTEHNAPNTTILANDQSDLTISTTNKASRKKGKRRRKNKSRRR
ncbi:hypothetical protein LJB42_002782 [Komagataella kurtzmanii]|nr:hypothetical protein LJB42_002782 [Komagataella kurtzmanii]